MYLFNNLAKGCYGAGYDIVINPCSIGKKKVIYSEMISKGDFQFFTVETGAPFCHQFLVWNANQFLWYNFIYKLRGNKSYERLTLGILKFDSFGSW